MHRQRAARARRIRQQESLLCAARPTTCPTDDLDQHREVLLLRSFRKSNTFPGLQQQQQQHQNPTHPKTAPTTIRVRPRGRRRCLTKRKFPPKHLCAVTHGGGSGSGDEGTLFHLWGDWGGAEGTLFHKETPHLIGFIPSPSHTHSDVDQVGMALQGERLERPLEGAVVCAQGGSRAAGRPGLLCSL